MHPHEPFPDAAFMNVPIGIPQPDTDGPLPADGVAHYGRTG